MYCGFFGTCFFFFFSKFVILYDTGVYCVFDYFAVHVSFRNNICYTVLYTHKRSLMKSIAREWFFTKKKVSN